MIGIQREKHEFWRFGLYVEHIATVLEREILFEDHIREGGGCVPYLHIKKIGLDKDDGMMDARVMWPDH